MRKQRASYSIPCLKILFFLLLLNPILSEGDVINSVRKVFNIYIEDSILGDALQNISLVSGTRIVLMSSSQPESLFTLHLEDTNIDNAIRKLLIGYDYVMVDKDEERVIFLIGKINYADPAIPVVRNNLSDQQIASIKKNKVDEIFPVSDSGLNNVDYIRGKILKGPDGIREFLPINNALNDAPGNGEYIYLNNSGIPEAIQVEQAHDVSDKREYIYLNNSGISEAIPVKQEYDVPDNREYIYLNNSGIPEAIPM